MTDTSMHADEIAIDINLVSKLIETQFPQWAKLSVKPINSSGTDNKIYRLGDSMAIRLPRIPGAAYNIDKEYQWLPQLSEHLPIAIPTPIAKGMPTKDFPWPWFIYQWLDGENATIESITNFEQAAKDLGHFVVALQRIDSSNAPISQRGGPLAIRDNETRAAIHALQGVINVDVATRVWELALNAPQWNSKPHWLHGDLHAGNVLIKEGRINAIIDFGLAGVGDPACDMMAVWTLLSSGTREIFRDIVQADDTTWMRGRGWALTFGLVALPYYKDTNPTLANIAHYTINEVLADTCI